MPELTARRIEAIGFQVGHQLSERFIMGDVMYGHVLKHFNCPE